MCKGREGGKGGREEGQGKGHVHAAIFNFHDYYTHVAHVKVLSKLIRVLGNNWPYPSWGKV